MPGVAVDTVPALSSPDAGAALSSPADSATDAFVEDLMQADRPVEIWICAYVRVAAQQLQELATSLDSKAVPPGPVREACREKMLANMRLLIRFLLMRSPGGMDGMGLRPIVVTRAARAGAALAVLVWSDDAVRAADEQGFERPVQPGQPR